MSSRCKKNTFGVIGLGIFLMLSACAPLRVRETPAALGAQIAREHDLAAQTSWLIDAHIAVSSGSDGGSGELEWRQDAAGYAFTVRAPVTGRTWKLDGDESGATLEGVDPQPIRGSDPERLLRDRLGWDIPLAKLGAWVRGMRAAGSSAKVEYDAQNLPAVLEQDGWKVEYRDWFTDRTPPLPRKVYASRGNARVRMLIDQWSIHD
jgi:outer membrane lipoprotein LolB